MHVVAIIPARYASSRFPGKPVAKQTGKFLVQHVYERVLQTPAVNRCIIATDDQRIVDAVRTFDGEVAMTRPDHPSGADRIAEVAACLKLAETDLILNVQGDEPEIDPNDLDRLVQRMHNCTDCPVGTLACPFPTDADPNDPNCVKVVCRADGRALYFSRAQIPHPRDPHAAIESPTLLHIGVYAYRSQFLQQLTQMPPSKLEQTERLEQLRILQAGHDITVQCVDAAPAGIDTPEEYTRFVKRHRSEIAT